MKCKSKHLFTGMILVLHLSFTGCATPGSDRLSERNAVFTCTITADTREFAGPEFQSSQYFLGACEAIREVGKGSFMVSVGDTDPPQHVFDTIKKVLGEDYHWYPAVGNHETETPEDMEWLRNRGREDIPGLVRRGPENSEETTYSFDFRNAHFVVLNEFYDGVSDALQDGDITEPLYNWLRNDLETNTRPFIFVFGHLPIVSIPDYQNGRRRHRNGNLDAHPANSHRFQQLLREHEVTGYFCGHTHDFSYSTINGLWQLDVGHARGIGDRGAPSTFLKLFVGKRECWVEVYRDDADGGPYALTHTITLN